MVVMRGIQEFGADSMIKMLQHSLSTVGFLMASTYKLPAELHHSNKYIWDVSSISVMSTSVMCPAA